MIKYQKKKNPKSLEKVKVELNLSNYPTKTDLKNATRIYTASIVKKVHLINSKFNVDKLDIDKLKNVPTDLSNLKSKVDKLDVDKLLTITVNLCKLSDAVENIVAKKDIYNTKVKNIEDKTPETTNVATETILNAKINEDKDKIPSIKNLAT